MTKYQPNSLIRRELKRIIKESGLSQRQLAFQCGLSPQWLNHFLQGREGTRVETLEKICKALRVKGFSWSRRQYAKAVRGVGRSAPLSRAQISQRLLKGRRP